MSVNAFDVEVRERLKLGLGDAEMMPNMLGFPHWLHTFLRHSG